MAGRDSWTGVFLILGGALLFGVMPSAAAFAYDAGANALFLMLSRAAIGVVSLLFFIKVTGRRAQITAGSLRRSWLAGVSHSLAAFGLLASIRYIDISLVSIIAFMYPFPVAVAAHLKGETALTLPVLALMLLATAGMVLVLGVTFSSINLVGVALATLAMASFSVMIMAMAKLTREVGAPNSNLLMTIWSVLIFALIALLGPPSGLVSGIMVPQTMAGWGFVLLVGLTFAIGYLCFFMSTNLIGAARASLLSTAEPVLMILCAVAVVGEVLSPLQWLGVVVMVSSLSLSEVVRR